MERRPWELGGVRAGRPLSRAAHLSPENLPMVSQRRELNPRGGRGRKGQGAPKPFRLLRGHSQLTKHTGPFLPASPA